LPRFVINLALTLITSVMLAACGGGGGGGGGDVTQPTTPVAPYSYSAPLANGDGWEVADLADVGMDEAQLEAMMQLVVNGEFRGIDSVVIARNNKLVLHEQLRNEIGQFDEWIDNRDPERHVLHSTSKSFTSALIGIAIDQGYIASTQVKFYDLFNYGAYFNWDDRKADITLEDALTMRLGYEWDEWTLPYTDPNNDLVFLENNYTDWPKALLDLPMQFDPGTQFTYNTAATIAIGQALENATGIPMADFANQYLFYPMDITTAEWWLTPTGLPNGGSGLFLLSRDMAKFGQLFIDDGVWQGQQLISPEWIADSVTRRVDISSWATYSEAYGFQWWLDDFNFRGQTIEAYVTSGYGGQYIFCLPELDLVVAFTGRNYNNGVGVQALYDMVRQYILVSITS